MSHGLRTGFNVWGANLVAIALLGGGGVFDHDFFV